MIEECKAKGKSGHKGVFVEQFDWGKMGTFKA